MCDNRQTITAIGSILGAYTGGASGLLTGAAAGSAVANATDPVKNEVPKLLPTPVMPTIDSQGVARARELSIAKMMAQGGRESTILSQRSDTLGG